MHRAATNCNPKAKETLDKASWRQARTSNNELVLHAVRNSEEAHVQSCELVRCRETLEHVIKNDTNSDATISQLEAKGK